MSNIGKISLAVEIDGQGYFVALPHERLLLLVKMAEGLADDGKLPVKKFPPGFGFTDLTETRKPVPEYETALLAGPHGNINEGTIRKAMEQEIKEHRARASELATRCRAAGGMHETMEPETSLDKLAPPAKEKA